MHEIDGYGATEENQFTEGSPGAVPVPATYVTADWLNAVQNEMVNTIEAAGFTLDKENNTQLWQAVLALSGMGAGNVKTITNADSPYDVLSIDTILRIDCTDGAVVVRFPSGAATTARLLRCKKVDSTNNAVQYSPQAGETIEGESGSYDSVMRGEIMVFMPIGSDGWERIG